MSTGHPTPDHIRQHAIHDYLTSGDTYAVVAARNNVSRSTLHAWVNPDGIKKRKPKSWGADELAYMGGWEIRGGIKYPLAPERRTA